MILLNILIAAVLLGVAVIDYKRHIIPNQAIYALLLFGLIRSYLENGLVGLVHGGINFVCVYFVCFAIGYFYITKKGIDIAGGGDYKLISVFALIYELPGLLLCLVLELIYELIYRYLLFPEKKREALPMGASFGVFGLVLLILEATIG
jgi:Flp pilus assembly protein protease CpaA